MLSNDCLLAIRPLLNWQRRLLDSTSAERLSRQQGCLFSPILWKQKVAVAIGNSNCHFATECREGANSSFSSRSSRRDFFIVTAVWMESLVCWQPPSSAATSIQDLVDRAAPGDTINLQGGTYLERVVIDKRLVLRAAEEKPVTIIWETQDHYEPVLTCSGEGSISISGITFQHRSPSVANNYALYFQGGDVALYDCKVFSSTGTGIGVEGGSHQFKHCTLQGCKQHGFAAFSSIEGDSCKVRFPTEFGRVANVLKILELAFRS